MRGILKIIGLALAAILFLAIIAFALFAFNNLHWFDRYAQAAKRAGAVEKQITLPNGRIINYGEVENDNPPLLLIHGQSVAWQDYSLLMPRLSEKWHVYALDVYGHGKSCHDEDSYYLDENGDDVLWFIENVIGEKTVVAGHSNGAITAAYIASLNSDYVTALLLEDPPIFSIEGEGWEQSFSYLDTFKPMHDYLNSDKQECWEAYYLRNCYWGKLFMKGGMEGIANYAQAYRNKHPNEELRIFFLPQSITVQFHYAQNYDLKYGERFYDLSWNNGLSHKQILERINIPCIYLHAKESLSDTGIYLCAASREQADRAVAYIGDNCKLIETATSDHAIHAKYPDIYLQALEELRNEID